MNGEIFSAKVNLSFFFFGINYREGSYKIEPSYKENLSNKKREVAVKMDLEMHKDPHMIEKQSTRID
jgi:hypothetical protein